MKNNDVQLIHRILDGDETAFAELVEKYQKQVHALVWRKIGDFHIAEEITQDAFLKAYQELGTLKKPQRFASWLYVIATNRCSTWLRKKHLRRQLLEGMDVAQPEKVTYSEHVVVENEQITIETQRNVVKKLLAKLGESERTVMTLHYFGEMSCTEIGAFLGVSANTVKSRLHRAQQRLKKEEPMIREALDNFKITPNFTESIMQEISRMKPAAPSGSRPLIPWAVAASTLAVVLLMLGFGSHQYLARFQEPYSLDATAEMTVDIIDAPIVANLESKPEVRTQIGSANALDKRNNPEQQSNDAPAAIAEAQADEITEDWTKWELPKEAKARLGKGGINAMQFSPDGTLLAVGGSIGVWLYDVQTGKEISLFPGICRSLAFSPDGRFLANSGHDPLSSRGGSRLERGLELWEIVTVRKVTPHDAQAAAEVMRFSEDGKKLVSLRKSRDTISRLDVETGQQTVNKLEKRSGYVDEVYALTQDKIAIGRSGSGIEVWSTTTGEKLSTLRENEENEENDLSDLRDVIDLKVDQLLGGIRWSDNRVSAMAFSPDGTRLATVSDHTTLQLWDTANNNKPITFQKPTGWIEMLAFSPDGKMLASGGNIIGRNEKMVRLWDTVTGKLLATLDGHINRITALTFSPDGSTLASASADGEVLFWDTETRNPLPTNISGHTNWLKGAAFYKDSKTLASIAFNGIITFWDLKTQQESAFQTKGHHELLWISAFSPDGTKLVNTDHQLIRLTDVSTGRELASLTEPKGSSISGMAFSPDGKTVALGGHGRIRMWNTETGENFDISLSDPNDKSNKSVPMISALLFSPDGKKLVSGTTYGKVQMWDAETGVVLATYLIAHGIGNTLVDRKLHAMYSGIRITALAFSSDGAILAVGNREQIRLFGSQKKPYFKEVSEIVVVVNDEIVHRAHKYDEALVFSPDNTVLAAGLIGGSIQLLDIATGDELATLDGHTVSIEKLVFSPDGKTLVSVGADGTILLWDWDEVLKGLDR